jgi:hypothetical protein
MWLRWQDKRVLLARSYTDWGIEQRPTRMGNETARTSDARVTVKDCALSAEPSSTLGIEVSCYGGLMKRQTTWSLVFGFFGFTSSHRSYSVTPAQIRWE